MVRKRRKRQRQRFRLILLHLFSPSFPAGSLLFNLDIVLFPAEHSLDFENTIRHQFSMAAKSSDVARAGRLVLGGNGQAGLG